MTATAPSSTEAKKIRLDYFLVALVLLLHALLFVPHQNKNRGIFIPTLAFTEAVTLLVIAVIWSFRRRRERLEGRLDFRKAHVVQTVAQSGLYVVWCLGFRGAYLHIPLILDQILFAYAFYVLICLFRRQPCQIGFAFFPLVISINFFIWFRPIYYSFQLLMIPVALLAKMYLVRRVDGKLTHIFNPSGFVMALAAYCILFFDIFHIDHYSFHYPTALALNLMPAAALVIFAIGIIPQLVAKTIMVSLGGLICLAVMSLYSLSHHVFLLVSGFLALTLFMTDPKTSPRTWTGQFLYGFLYIFTLFQIDRLLILSELGLFTDKILLVPVFNYAAPWFDSLRVRVAFKKEKKILAAVLCLQLVVFWGFRQTIGPVLSTEQKWEIRKTLKHKPSQRTRDELRLFEIKNYFGD